ncbi:MAG: hypothetical protein M1819_006403 [Sarea resinae]|nr:MAG: hypothetical protein M1819_006403 [Sarea resinae]
MKAFQESLTRTPRDQDGDGDHYLGLSLREMIHEFKYQTLVLFKSCLLQPKMLFFGSRCERLCMMQFSLISLIPGLLRSLQDCADPELDNYEQGLATPTSLRTSDRNSLLSYMGLPLQIFGKGSLFGPYTPLQQLDILADFGTKSYIVGSTNSLLLQQRDRYSDVLVNLDETTISITSTSLRAALALSAADRRWIDFLTQTINDTWDETNPGRPKTMGYVGSEEFIRLQFEEYLLALVSSVKYHIYVEKHQDDPKALLSGIGNPANDFGTDWVDAWMKTENFRIFNKFTDSHVFDIVEPRHPCAGGLTMEDVQRRLAQQVSELHLDERFNSGREVLGKHLATGQKKVSTAFNALWADMEAMREAQRQRAEEAKANPPAISEVPRTPDLSSASSRAGAYLSSWGQWASEKRKAGWGARNSTSLPLSGAYSAPRASISSPTSPVPSSPTTTSTSTTAAEETRRSSSLLSSSSAAHAEAATYSPPRGSKSESESRDGEEGSQSVEMVEVFDRDRGVDAEREEESQGQAQRRGSNGGIISAESVDEEDEKESNGGGAEEPDEAKQGERVDTH